MKPLPVPSADRSAAFERVASVGELADGGRRADGGGTGAGTAIMARPVDPAAAVSAPRRAEHASWSFEPRRWAAKLLSLYASGFEAAGWRRWGILARGLSLELDADRLGVWLRHANALRLNGRRDEGLAQMREGVAALRRLEAGSGGRRPPTSNELAQHWARLSRAWVAFSKRTEAEAAIERAVELAPDRPGLWTAYARMAGYRADDAKMLAANLRAHELAPQDMGVAAALANAYVLIDREASAAEVHRRFRATPAIARERRQKPVRSLSAPWGGANSQQTPPIVLDLTDLLNFLKRRRFVSGIQRVQAELALALLRRRRPGQFYPALFDERRGRWRLADPEAVIALILAARRRRLFGAWRLRR